MAKSSVVKAYENFSLESGDVLNVNSEESYQRALEALDEIFDSMDDELDSHLNPLVELLSASIEKYESQDDGLNEFIRESDETPMDIVMLRTLMNSYHLTGSDLPEIGDKTMVSKVLNGKRQLTRNAIEALSARFGLRPAMFFESA